MPELEKRKAEYSRRRQMNAPINFEAINNHSQLVDNHHDGENSRRQQAVKARAHQLAKWEKGSNYSSTYISAYKEEKRQWAVEREKEKV